MLYTLALALRNWIPPDSTRGVNSHRLRGMGCPRHAGSIRDVQKAVLSYGGTTRRQRDFWGWV